MDPIRNINNKKRNVEQKKQFWSNIWDNEKKHERNAEWLRELRLEKDNMKQNDINITPQMIKQQVKKISNWKSRGPDRVQGYWLRKLTTLHESTARQMDNTINNREGIPKWMTLVKTVLCQKVPSKGYAVDNYRPISYLILMWKLMDGTTAESVYNILDVNDKLPVKQKRCREKVKDQRSIIN